MLNERCQLKLQMSNVGIVRANYVTQSKIVPLVIRQIIDATHIEQLRDLSELVA